MILERQRELTVMVSAEVNAHYTLGEILALKFGKKPIKDILHRRLPHFGSVGHPRPGYSRPEFASCGIIRATTAKIAPDDASVGLAPDLIRTALGEFRICISGKGQYRHAASRCAHRLADTLHSAIYVKTVLRPIILGIHAHHANFDTLRHKRTPSVCNGFRRGMEHRTFTVHDRN